MKYLGLSECNASTIRRAHKVHPIAAVQVEQVHHARRPFIGPKLIAYEQVLAFRDRS